MINTNHILRCYGNHSNHSDRSITPLPYAVLSPYLGWWLFGVIGISHIPHCYSN